MHCIDYKIISEAKINGVEISIFDLLSYNEAVKVRLTNQIPDWIVVELSKEGLCIEKCVGAQWFIGRIDQ